jgi:acyl-CoA synthetase (AMP-forming)/AMP-acid ligase II
LQFDEERLHVYRDKMDFIETGAAPMTQGDMERLCKILPNTRLYNTYASTETGIVSTHDYCHDGCMSGCLGYPMVNARIRITENHNIICGGSTIMTGYLGDSELTRRILREGEIYTSDLGYMDDMNRLRLLGRVDDVINVGGFKVHPIEVEDVVMQHAAIKDCICIRCSHPIVGSALKLLYVLNPSVSFDRKCFVAYLKEHLESYKLPILYEQKDSIVRTYNGKLNRKFYEVEK